MAGKKGPHKPDQTSGPPAARGCQKVPISRAEQNAFLAELSKHGVLAWAARAIGRSHAGILGRMERSPEFAAEVEEAIAQANASIELAAIERGVKGVERLEISAGQIVRDAEGNPVVRREYSDALLLAVLRARDQRFRTKQSIDVNHSHKGGGANITTDDIFLLDEDDRDQFLHLLSKIEAKRRGEGDQSSQAQLAGPVEDAEWSDADGDDLDPEESAELAAIL